MNGMIRSNLHQNDLFLLKLMICDVFFLKIKQLVAKIFVVKNYVVFEKW